MTLGQKQRLFCKLVPRLIDYAYDKGFELTWGDAYRDPRTTYGHPNSAHRKRLAVDFNLFIGGVYQVTTEAHEVLGEYWESLHPLCRWGGRFQDGNHYSIEHNGIK